MDTNFNTLHLTVNYSNAKSLIINQIESATCNGQDVTKQFKFADLYSKMLGATVYVDLEDNTRYMFRVNTDYLEDINVADETWIIKSLPYDNSIIHLAESNQI